jgi:hypothetical protein
MIADLHPGTNHEEKAVYGLIEYYKLSDIFLPYFLLSSVTSP